MAYSLKKVLTAMAASFVALSATVSASNGSYTYASGPGSFGNCGPVCCPTNTCNPCGCGDWFVDVDVLYWKACEGGLMYGSVTEETELDTTTATFDHFDTKKKNPHHRWDVGVRVGLGYHFACECYDAAVYWTHFDTDAHGHWGDCSDFNRWFTPAWSGVDTHGLLGGNRDNGTNPVSHASAHWKLRLNLLDAEIGRSFCVNSCLSLRPYVGVRGAFIDQNYKLEYVSSRDVSGQEVCSPTDEFHLKSDFEGAGIRIGMDTDYNLGCGVSLFGDLAASLLWGETEVKTKEKYTFGVFPGSTDVIFMSQKDRDCGSRAITDASLGLRWQQCCCNKVITLEFAWEHHFFFNNNDFEKFTNFDAETTASAAIATDRYPQVIHGDLSVQGFVFSGKVEF